MSYEYLISLQIAKRNLTVAERIRLAEKSRPAIEKAAKEKQAEYHGNQYEKSGLVPTLAQVQNPDQVEQNKTNAKLAEIAGVGKETYRKGKRVLDSDNKEIIDRMVKGELSVNAAYKAIVEGERLSIMETAMRKVDFPKILRKLKVKIKFHQIRWKSKNQENYQDTVSPNKLPLTSAETSEKLVLTLARTEKFGSGKNQVSPKFCGNFQYSSRTLKIYSVYHEES